jgi:quercetin dioxygenase-like cupin family protein
MTTLENPVTGERFTFTVVRPELLAFDFALREGGSVPIPHVHPVQTERFHVTHGRVRFRLGWRKVVAHPGDVIEVPPGVAHSFANDGAGEARMRVEVSPALDMQEMFREVVAMAEAGRMNRRGMPRNVFDLAALARRYDLEAHAPLLTLTTQRLLLAPLLWLRGALAAMRPRPRRAARCA